MSTPGSLSEAAATGRRIDALVALRDTLARSIDTCESMRDLAALSARMTEVLAQIEGLSPPERKGDAVDEIAQRRTARRAGAASGQARPKRSG